MKNYLALTLNWVFPPKQRIAACGSGSRIPCFLERHKIGSVVRTVKIQDNPVLYSPRRYDLFCDGSDNGPKVKFNGRT